MCCIGDDFKLKPPPVTVTKINEDLWFFNGNKTMKEAFQTCIKYGSLLAVLPKNGTDKAALKNIKKDIKNANITYEKAVWVGFARKHVIQDGRSSFT